MCQGIALSRATGTKTRVALCHGIKSVDMTVQSSPLRAGGAGVEDAESSAPPFRLVLIFILKM